MLPTLTNMLAWWQWLILAMVPPAIIALYFLKLRRQPLEVPSTYLWKKSIEDLHVNSLWQRLRRSLLLWLQLAVLSLVMLALISPSWRGNKFSGNRFVFLVDLSASMSAVDVIPPGEDKPISRLDEAKRRIGESIDAMKSGDAAMIITFANNAHVAQEFTTDRQLLRKSLKDLEPTNRSTTMSEALRLAAGLANPSRTGNTAEGDAAAADAKPAEMFVYSDFKFPDVVDFSLGNLEPQFELIGDPDQGNVAIVTLTNRRHEKRADQIQVFARLDNYTGEETTVTAELLLGTDLIDVKSVTIPAGGTQRVTFTIEDVERGILQLRIDAEDALNLDNRAWTVINPQRRSRLLFVSTGNTALERALGTAKVEELVLAESNSPDVLKTTEYRKKSETGFYDLIIYDRCQPEVMPQANTVFIGQLPIDKRWEKGAAIPAPQIIDTERTHPLMQLLDLGDIFVAEAFELKPPPGGTPLVESQDGPIIAIGPREGFEDAVLGFEFESTDEDGSRYYNTNWPLRRSFPVFVQELITYLGDRSQSAIAAGVSPGQPMPLPAPTVDDNWQVVLPDESKATVRRGHQSRYQFNNTDQLGVYEVQEGGKFAQRFTVNMFDPMESDIRPVAGTTTKRIGNVDVEIKRKANVQVSRYQAWKLLALLGLGVLVLEWYIYNRRVYI